MQPTIVDWLQNDNLSQNVISIRLSKNVISLFLVQRYYTTTNSLFANVYPNAKVRKNWIIDNGWLIYIPICLGISIKGIIDNIITISHLILSIRAFVVAKVCTIVVSITLVLTLITVAIIYQLCKRNFI